MILWTGKPRLDIFGASVWWLELPLSFTWYLLSLRTLTDKPSVSSWSCSALIVSIVRSLFRFMTTLTTKGVHIRWRLSLVTESICTLFDLWPMLSKIVLLKSQETPVRFGSELVVSRNMNVHLLATDMLFVYTSNEQHPNKRVLRPRCSHPLHSAFHQHLMLVWLAHLTGCNSCNGLLTSLQWWNVKMKDALFTCKLGNSTGNVLLGASFPELFVYALMSRHGRERFTNVGKTVLTAVCPLNSGGLLQHREIRLVSLMLGTWFSFSNLCLIVHRFCWLPTTKTTLTPFFSMLLFINMNSFRSMMLLVLFRFHLNGFGSVLLCVEKDKFGLLWVPPESTMVKISLLRLTILLLVMSLCMPRNMMRLFPCSCLALMCTIIHSLTELRTKHLAMFSIRHSLKAALPSAWMMPYRSLFGLLLTVKE